MTNQFVWQQQSTILQRSKNQRSKKDKRRMNGDELISCKFLVWRQCVQFGLRAHLCQRTYGYDIWASSCCHTYAATGFGNLRLLFLHFYFLFSFFFWEIAYLFSHNMHNAMSRTPMQGFFKNFFSLYSSRIVWTCFSMAAVWFVVIVVGAVDGSRHVGILSTFQLRQQKYYCDDSLVLSDDCWTVRYITCIVSKIKFYM